MDLDALKMLACKLPFRPFVVTLKDGRRLLAQRPNQMMVSPNGYELVYSDDQGGSGFNRIPVRLIDRWEVQAEEHASS